MNILTSGDINVYGSLDEECALGTFPGKAVKDSEALFRDNGKHCSELLVRIGPRARRYCVGPTNWRRRGSTTRAQHPGYRRSSMR